jgi:SlyX protein
VSGDSQRIEALEFKVAHLERALAELSDVLARQQRELDAMRERHRQLLARLAEWETPTGASADGHEPPPHY